MEEKDVRKFFSKNLIKLRKQRNLTQTQLAEKLNYSDKSISKWECGDVMPDVVTVKKIADFFNITIDALLCDDLPAKSTKEKRNAIITALSVGLTWFIASIVYFVLSAVGVERCWLVFIVALPVSSVVFLVLSYVWFNTIIRLISVTLLVATLATAIFIVLLDYNLWFIFVVALIFEILTVCWFLLRRYVKATRLLEGIQQNKSEE